MKTQKPVFDLARSDKKTEHLERSNKNFRALCITHIIFDVLRYLTILTSPTRENDLLRTKLPGMLLEYLLVHFV
jgi:hypothetical protein